MIKHLTEYLQNLLFGEEYKTSNQMSFSNTLHVYPIKKEFLTHVAKKRHILKAGTDLPNKVDLRSGAPPIFDQGSLGSCTANAILGAYEYSDKAFNGSRLFLYYNERVADGDSQVDAGSTISQGISVFEKLGCCEEKSWPYDVKKFADKPSEHCYTEALQHKVLQATPIDPTTLKECLANGFPVMVGIQVYQSFESDTVASTGIVPMPTDGEQLLGGHAVCVYGFDDENQRWIMRNSWGVGWGDLGYFYLPYDYLKESNLASDFWEITKVEQNSV